MKNCNAIGITLKEISDLLSDVNIEAHIYNATSGAMYRKHTIPTPMWLSKILIDMDNPPHVSGRDFWQKNNKGQVIASADWFNFIEFMVENNLIDNAEIYFILPQE